MHTDPNPTFVLVCLLALAGCGAPSSTPADGGTTGADGGGGACTLTADTTATGTTTDGCALLDRNTDGCRASREAAGLTGFWLRFSCRVTLTVVTKGSATYVELASDDEPDYPSNYFPSTSPCHDDYTPSFPDPNHIVSQSFTVTVPLVPSGAGQPMGLGPVGMAVNGVAIFDDQAAPGDDIYKESGSFDRCQGHPQRNGMYHYHSEPYAITHDDDRFVGVLRDGNPVYGRRDPDGSVPTLDAAGGHTGVTEDSPKTPVYHYQVNLQTSTHAGTAGQQVWFITTGTYHNAPG